MSVYKKVVGITCIVFIFMMILIMTYDTETDVAPSVENSSLVILNDLMDKIIVNIDDPFEEKYYDDGTVVDLEYLTSYKMVYTSSSKRVSIDNETQKATISLPEYGEETVFINLSIQFDEVKRSKEFEIVLYGEQEIYFSEYFHSDSEYSFLVLSNNSDHTVDLGDYELKLDAKGSSILKTFELDGDLLVGESIKLTTSEDPGEDYYQDTLFSFSGEDIIYIYNSDIIVDVVGSGLTDLENVAYTRTTEEIVQIETYSPSDWDNIIFSINLVVDGEAISQSLTGIYKGFARFPELSKEGYTLSNWYYDAAKKEIFLEQFFGSSDITIYATWELES